VVTGSIYDGADFNTSFIKLSGSGNVMWKKRSQAATTLSNKSVEFRGICTNGNTTVSAGAGYNEGCVMSVMDTLGNGICNDVQFDLANVHPALTSAPQTITAVNATAINATVSYTNTSNVYTPKYVYCGSLSAIDEEIAVENKVTLFPNPASGEIQILGYNDWPATVSIYSLSGQKLSEIMINKKEDKVIVDKLQAGYYLMRINSNEKNSAELLPFIKE
jgi:hypothetical protein